ncbi:MAG: sigma-54 dependent transcriptional regulator [Proteobacteria bacterium]|nr:sigma-54 dependent transcriptional regulator [Pseudomonadota bacterium]MBU1686615.1 sigma-54 dependent transcriptional regulator [Pseudomonadota bacterium]
MYEVNREELNSLLIIDDEENMRHMLSILAEGEGYRVKSAADGIEALEILAGTPFDFILCDLKMPRMDGMAFLDAVGELKGNATIIMMSAYSTIDLALEAIKKGAYDFIPKPFKPDEVLLALKKAEEKEKLSRENVRLRSRLRNLETEVSFGAMVGSSRPMKDVFSLANKVAKYSTTVLITGESGTGKELIARGIHIVSPRSERPLVPVNCGSIPETLLESELFGHVKGAFTGADRDHKGLFEEADGGTILLDEIGDLPSLMQVKILRVLQEGEIRPVGSSHNKKLDVRVLAATSVNLEEAIQQGTFREDLYYRLNVMPIRMPSLREHPEDIPFLCQLFIERFNKQLSLRIEGVSPGAMSLLVDYRWPGNVRELENLIERAMVLAETNFIQRENLPASLIGSKTESNGPNDDELVGFSLKEAKKVWEKKLISRALQTTGGNRSRAAELLELSFPSLLSKIKEYQIVVPEG